MAGVKKRNTLSKSAIKTGITKLPYIREKGDTTTATVTPLPSRTPKGTKRSNTLTKLPYRTDASGNLMRKTATPRAKMSKVATPKNTTASSGNLMKKTSKKREY